MANDKNTKKPAETKAAETNQPEEKKAPAIRKIGKKGYSEPTQRTETEYPILTTPPEMPPVKKRNSSYYMRALTFEVVGKQTFHAQENGKLLVNFLNKKYGLKDALMLQCTIARGHLNVFNTYQERTFNLQESRPEPKKFIADIEGMTRETQDLIKGLTKPEA